MASPLCTVIILGLKHGSWLKHNYGERLGLFKRKYRGQRVENITEKYGGEKKRPFFGIVKLHTFTWPHAMQMR